MYRLLAFFEEDPVTLYSGNDYDEAQFIKRNTQHNVATVLLRPDGSWEGGFNASDTNRGKLFRPQDRFAAGAILECIQLHIAWAIGNAVPHGQDAQLQLLYALGGEDIGLEQPLDDQLCDMIARIIYAHDCE